MRLSAFVVASMMLFGCTTVRYQRFGDVDPTGDRQVVEKFETVDAKQIAHESVRVLVDAVPEGISVNNGVIEVQSGYAHQLLGKFSAYSPYGLGPIEEGADILRRAAVAAGANLAIAGFEQLGDRLTKVSAVLIKIDPKFDLKSLPTTATPQTTKSNTPAGQKEPTKI